MAQSNVPYEQLILRRNHETWNRVRNPPAWAQHRNEMKDALIWFNEIQGGVHMQPTSTKPRPYILGVLIARHSGRRSYMDAEIIITSLNGEQKKTTEGHTTERRRRVMADTIQNRGLIGVIFERGSAEAVKRPEDGDRISQLMPCANMPTIGHEEQNCWVADWFLPTFMWPMKIDGQGGSVWMVRLEKYNLSTQSWWANPQHALPPRDDQRNFSIQVQQENCSACSTDSPRVYNEMFVCTNDRCDQVWRHNGELISPTETLTYTDGFLQERKPRPLAQVTYPTGESELIRDFQQWYALNYQAPMTSNQPMTADTFRQRMKDLLEGFVCPYCNMMNTRGRWHQWHCRNSRCNYTIAGYPPTISLQEVTTLGTAAHHSLNLTQHPAYRWTHDTGDFTAHEFILGEGCNVAYLVPKPGTNAKPKSSDWLYQEIQRQASTGALPLERRWLHCPAGPIVTSHFAANYGESYIFAARVPSVAIENAPSVVQDAIQTVNGWTRPWRSPQDHPANELYLAGYFSGQKMNWHDDGETGLEDIITTYTLGGSGTFSLGIKPRYDSGFQTPTGNRIIEYDPVIPGCKLEAQRRTLRDQLQQGQITQVQWQDQFRTLMNTIPRRARAGVTKLIDFPVHHGCLVIMYGRYTQRYLEHCVNVDTPMRFALTFRHITAEHTNADELAELNKRIGYDISYDPGEDWTQPQTLPPVGDDDVGQALPQVSPRASPPRELPNIQADDNGDGHNDDNDDGSTGGDGNTLAAPSRRQRSPSGRGEGTRRVRARVSRNTAAPSRGAQTSRTNARAQTPQAASTHSQGAPSSDTSGSTRVTRGQARARGKK